MKKLIIMAVAVIAVTASVSFSSCSQKEAASLDSLINALDSANQALENIDTLVVDSLGE